MPDHSLREEVFPYVYPKPPLTQLVAIFSGRVCCLGEEAKPLLIPTSFQEVVDFNEVSPKPPLLQTKQSQLPQSHLIGLVLQTPLELRHNEKNPLYEIYLPHVALHLFHQRGK